MTAELLYHTVLTVVDYHSDASGSTRTVYILGTHTKLEVAKQFAANALHSLGYEPEEFAVFEGHQPGQHWRHGDGVIIYSKAHSGQELLVGLLTTPNTQGLASRGNGTLDLPHGGHLQYVLQQKTDYNTDRSGAVQNTDIEGCFLHRAEAIKFAKECLVQAVGPKEEFARYDEREDLGPAEDWPFGEDILVHAIAETGENYSVAVRTPPDAHNQHGKHVKKHHKEHKLPAGGPIVGISPSAQPV